MSEWKFLVLDFFYVDIWSLSCTRPMPCCRETQLSAPCGVWRDTTRTLIKKCNSVIKNQAVSDRTCHSGSPSLGVEDISDARSHLHISKFKAELTVTSPKNGTRVWQAGGCEVPDLTVLKAQSVFFLLSPQRWKRKVPSKCHWSWKWSW